MGRMSTLEERLSSSAAAAREHSLAQQRVQELQRRIDDLERVAQEQRSAHREEQDDVKQLEGPSITRIFAAVSGSRDEKLARERAEADAAHLRLRHTESQIEALRRDQAREQARVEELSEAPRQLAAVLEEKEEFLREIGDPRADRLFELADEEGQMRGEIRELNEAVEAAQAADTALRDAAVSLDSAGSWSTYDTYLGGGMLASSMKHSHLDKAAEATSHAEECLAVLRTELADVSADSVHAPEVAVGGGMRTMDVWLDNLFTDLAVHDRIKKAQEEVAHAAASVADVMAGLAERAHRTRDRLTAIDEERRRILTEPTPPSS